MNITDFYNKKQSHQKISVITCYDYSSSRILSETSVDCLLVGDSVAMTMHGFKNTLSATIEMMCMHTEAVSRGAGGKFIVTDLPFLSYRKSLSDNVSATQRLMQSGAHAIKLEGVAGNLELITHLTESGVPVMGHVGLTPQFINVFGGYKIQGRDEETADKLKKEVLKLQEAGCFALVIECVPRQLAKELTELLAIPTIGIGAGPDTDGQVLVFQDMLGLNIDFKPKFVKIFSDLQEHIKAGVEQYVRAINLKEFPEHEHCY